MSALIGPAIGAAGSIVGGMMSGSGSRSETKRERQSRKAADDLMSSLRGDGPFSDLFSRDEAAFQRSFVDPAMSRFKNQIAPGIQQMYGASGMSRGTAMDDALLRAGVDLNQQINQQYLPFIQGGQNNAMQALMGILGQSAGAPQQPSMMQNLGQAASGYLSGDAFKDAAKDFGDWYNKPAAKREGREPGQGYGVKPTPRGHLPEFGQTGGY